MIFTSLRKTFATLFLWSRNATNETSGDPLQPNIRIIEEQPQWRSYGSISMPEGSPWCGGNKTYWLTGHQKNETPFCYDAELDNWTQPKLVVLDLKDPKDLPLYIDRHGCTTLDVNRDGLPDIICVIGANEGNGEGYTELYLTQPDGTLVKVPDHGLQKYPSIRGRHVTALHNTVDDGNITHVFIGAYGTYRPDNLTNVHTMYRLVDPPEYFEEVTGPFNIHAKARHVLSVDWNQDGRDDLIVTHDSKSLFLLEQEEGGVFRELTYEETSATARIRAARVADMDGDGRLDLIVSTWGYQKYSTKEVISPKLKVFLGIDGAFPFNFETSYYALTLLFEAPDLEILDVNDDGIPDIYVTQTDESSGSYCGEPTLWKYKNNPDLGWYAPLDEANDLLLLGQGYTERKIQRFEQVVLEHQIPGCGFLSEKFGDNKTMILASGNEGHPGSQALLSW